MCVFPQASTKIRSDVSLGNLSVLNFLLCLICMVHVHSTIIDYRLATI